MNKYIRVPPAEIRRAPAHRFVGYIHGLSSKEALTEEEYLNVWKEQHEEFGNGAVWTDADDKEGREALQWLVDNGLARIV